MYKVWTIVMLFLILLFSGIIQPLLSQNVSIVDSLNKILVYEQDEENKINILILLAKKTEGFQPQESVTYALNALTIARKEGLVKEEMLSLLQLAQGYIRLSRYDEAYDVCQNALTIAKHQHYKPETAKARNILSIIYYEIGDYEKSSAMDFENLKYYEHIKDQKQIGITLGNIGINFFCKRNYTKGLEYLKLSFEMALKLNDLHGMAYQYNNIAVVYSEYFKDFKTALDYFKEALKINSKLNDKRQEAIYQMNIAVCFLDLNEHDSAFVYLNQSKETFAALENDDLYSESLTHLGKYYLDKHDLEASLDVVQQAYDIAKQNGFLERLMKAAELIHKVYLLKGDTSLAYHFAMVQHQAKDSLMLTQNQQEIFKLEFQYLFEKQEKARQLAAQRKEIVLFIIILCLISGLSIVLLLFSRHRHKSRSMKLKKESVEKELEFKNKELTINFLSLMKKNEMLADISTRLTTIERVAKKEETKDEISKICKEIRSNASDKMLNEFTMRFQEVHKGFYESLLKKFPDLTQNELKLCAYLRLNMSSKEISELTGQRILTLEHARYRLRKKLGISNSEINLSGFLANFNLGEPGFN